MFISVLYGVVFFFCKQKTAYEMRISDWSSDVCSSDLPVAQQAADCIRAARDAQVVSVDTERVREAPPLPFDLGTLQEVCSKQLCLDVQETLDIESSEERRVGKEWISTSTSRWSPYH